MPTPSRASSSRRKSGSERPTERPPRVAAGLVAGLIVVLAIAVVGRLSLDPVTRLLGGDERAVSSSISDPDAPLSSIFSREVLHWRDDILRWARDYRVNPNVIAIVIQIESCGDSDAVSVAGALGLMQVMPFHFDYGENMLNPDTNVFNGMTVFYECLTQFADWNLGLALACYNGGPGVTQQDFDAWALETQYYYTWATGLWNDVVSGQKTSSTLKQWLDAGGSRLCAQAAESQAALE
jgi:soluble lytic murein transglycosylase-like protein